MASTYVNDLRLNEMATGDQSGSWGTVTNTNLELIGEAFSYGTETIGDADSTLTIADGASDPVRSFFLKITSSADLTTTRIVTIAPNTVSKVWMIENATTGSQIITIKQGSGATINVPNGQVKMISTDGAGSGAAVTDLLVDVDLTGTTTLVNLDVSGTALVTGVLTTTAATVFNGGFASNANSTIGGTLGVTGVVTANAGVVVDNITIDGTTIALSSGDLTLDAAGSIIFDADGADYFFKNGGTEVLRISGDATPANVTVRVMPSDGDFIIKGNDGGSTITALTLDMSAAGYATFNDGIRANRDIASFGSNTGSSANRMAMSMEGAGVSRLISNGPDASTKGTFEVFNASSSGTGAVGLKLNALDGLIITPLAGGHAIFNEGGVDADFRVESDGNANMLFVDGGSNFVTVGDSSTFGGDFNVFGALGIRGKKAAGYLSASMIRPTAFGYSVGTYAVTMLGDTNTQGTVSIGYDPSGNPGGSFSGTGIEMLFGANMYLRQPNAANNGYVDQIRMENQTGVIINEGGSDLDFRVESDTNTHMLFVDGGGDYVSVGTSSNLNGRLNVSGSIVATNAQSIDPDDLAAGYVALGTIADGSGWGAVGIGWKGAGIGDTAAIGYAGENIYFAMGDGANASSFATLFKLGRNEIVVNEESHNIDFRVESDTNANMLLVDAGANKVSVGSVPTASLAGGATFSVSGSTGISDGANSGTFKRCIAMGGSGNVTIGTLTGSSGATASAFLHGAHHYATAGSSLITYIKLAATRKNGDGTWTDIDNTTVAVASSGAGGAEPQLAWASGVLTVVTAANQGFVGTIEVMWGQGSAVFTSP